MDENTFAFLRAAIIGAWKISGSKKKFPVLPREIVSPETLIRLRRFAEVNPEGTVQRDVSVLLGFFEGERSNEDSGTG